MDGAPLIELERWVTMHAEPELRMVRAGLLEFGSAISIHLRAQASNLSWSKLVPFEREGAMLSGILATTVDRETYWQSSLV